MIIHHAYEVEPWTVRERALPTDLLAASESIFALANGHIGLRGNLDEGEPYGVPGSYLNGFYELHPLPYAEAGYGFPESGQTIINVTNGKPIRLLVDDEPFDVRYGDLRSHERVLDLRDGVLRREVEWYSPAGDGVRISSVRLVSFAQRAIAATLYEVEPIDNGVRVVAQSELVANEPVPAPVDMDPRAGALLIEPLRSEWHANDDLRAILVHSTRSSGLRMVAAMDHVIDGPEGLDFGGESSDDVARITATVRLEPGEKLRIVKFIAYAWSSQRSLPALRAQAAAALAEAKATGWDEICRAQRAYLDSFWDGADVVVEGDAELQQALRFALFQLLQASGRAEMRAIPSKGLTGPGYDGHTFWDAESFVLQALTYTAPDAARDALRWRHATIDLARERAMQLGLQGAAFPWRTIRGQECSGYWPAGTAAFHIGADIADAALRYAAVTGDAEFAEGIGLELLVETARLWRSLGHHDSMGAFRIDGVTGPDEYSAIADNNVYTNLMAEQNLRAAAEAVARYGDRASELGVGQEEAASWRDAAAAMLIPYDESLAVHRAGRGFHAPRGLGLRGDTARPVPAAAALPVLRPVPEAGREAGRPRARDAPARRLFQRGGEGQELRLLRGADGARLVPLGVYPGRDRGGGRPSRACVRLPARVRSDRYRGSRGQHPRGAAHGGARRDVDRDGGRLRWPSRPRRRDHPGAALARRALASLVPSADRREPPVRGRRSRARRLLRRRGRSGRAVASRRAAARLSRSAGGAPHSGDRSRPAPLTASRAPSGSPAGVRPGVGRTLVRVNDHIGAPDAALRRRLDALARRLDEQRATTPPPRSNDAPELYTERAEEVASVLFADRDERYPHRS